MKCPKCQAEVQEGWKNCVSCGNAISTVLTAPMSAAQSIHDSVIGQQHITQTDARTYSNVVNEQTDARVAGGANVGGGVHNQNVVNVAPAAGPNIVINNTAAAPASGGKHGNLLVGALLLVLIVLGVGIWVGISGSRKGTEGEASKPNPPSQVVVDAPKIKVVRKEAVIPKFESTDQIEYLEARGRGEGASRREALNHALAEAISKRLGTTVQEEVQKSLESDTEQAGQRTPDQQGLISRYEGLTKGLIKWFEVESEVQEEGRYVVEVAAVVVNIKAQGASHDTRKTLAVLPFRVSEDVNILGRTVNAVTLGRQIRESTLTYLVQSRKFAVIDKSFEEDLKRLSANPMSDLTQQALADAVKLGAQYVVIGTVDGFGVVQKAVGSMKIPIASGTVNLRVIKSDSRQVVMAKAFTVGDLEKINLASEKPETAILDALGRSMADRIMETIHPFKVAAFNGEDEIILNRGGDVLAVGDRLELFNPGEEIKDSATGESLGVAERKVGVAEVVRVLPNMSYARVIEKSEPVKVEAICRSPQLPKTEISSKANPKKSGDEINNLFK